MPDLAVIMSVYKNDKLNFLKESVQSILNQTFSQFHYYIIFDGTVSTEIETYVTSLTDNRIKLFRLEKNGGLAAALNYLLEIVIKNLEFKLIARMDADDVSMPERFEKQRDFLLENSEISCVGSWYREIDEDGNHLSERILPIENEDLRKYYLKRAPFAHPSVMYRRELIEKAGFYPEDTFLLEDNVLWGNALKHGLKFANLPEFLLNFRIDRNFFSRRSGLRFGFNYIINRFKINKTLKAPLHIYFYSLCVGMIRMMPAILIRYIYLAARRY